MGRKKPNRTKQPDAEKEQPSTSDSSAPSTSTSVATSSSVLEESFSKLSTSGDSTRRPPQLISGAIASKIAAPADKIPKFKNLEERRTIGVGKEGRKMMVRVNHFELNIKLPKGHIYHYDVDWKTPWKRDIRKSDKTLLVRVLQQAKQIYKKIFPEPNAVVFDGFKNVYTAHELPFKDKQRFEINIREVEDIEREIKMEMTLKLVQVVNVDFLLNEYKKNGTTETMPNSAVMLLNTVLGMTPSVDANFLTYGRSYFNPYSNGRGDVIDIGGGKSLWMGTFQSIRLGWKPMLNVDMANKPAMDSKSLVEFAAAFFFCRPTDLARKLSQSRCFEQLSSELKDLKLRFFRPDGNKRDYKINKLVKSAQQLRLKKDDKEMSIVDYFRTEYKYSLKMPDLPCLHVGNPNATIYLPMELCDLKKQFLPRSKRLGDKETADMIKKTAIEPRVREQRIKTNLKNLNDNFRSDPFAKAFGISVSDQLAQVEARVLTAPLIGYYKDAVTKKDEQVNPYNGKWDMGRCHFKKGMSLDNWGILDLARINQTEKEIFVNALYEEALKRGLEINFPIYQEAEERQAERSFKDLYSKLKSRGSPHLIMIFVESKSSGVYGLLKYVGDVELRVASQFILRKNISQKPKFQQAGRNNPSGPSLQTIHNICLKLNSKLGGTNQTLHSSVRPKVLQTPVIFMGADVTHPSPEMMSKKPSIAAAVGSMDANAALYRCEVRVQFGQGQVVEEILEMESIAKSLLMSFYETNSCRKPGRIIFYRDGVSEGQFLNVMEKEISAIRRACSQIEAGYQPLLTYMVAQKRHKTRIFPMNYEKDGVGRMKNVPPGTVVDSIIASPTETDFYLASHEGIQGTTKPTHYHLLWDDSSLSVDELQKLTYYLCHLYTRCERSVSYPAPTYYSHLAAFRARDHHNALMDKGILKGDSSDKDKPQLKAIEKMGLFNYFV